VVSPDRPPKPGLTDFRRYCSKCLLWAVDPTNPRPTRFPLVSTLKRDFPPKPKLPAAKPRKSLKRSPSSSSLDPRRDSPVIKRTRVDSERKSEVNSEEPSHHHTNGHLPTADIKLNGSSVNGDLGTKGHATPNGHVIAIGNKMIIPDPPSEGINRPKRQAALNRPDYHALHHHIATPTGKWLQLIGDPEKYGKVIKEGKPVIAISTASTWS